jgi:ankyrin repeat protein
MVEGCPFKASRKDNLRQHHIRAHGDTPRTRPTFFEETGSLKLPELGRSAKGPLALAPPDRSQDTGQSWAGKVFLQGATTGNLAILEASLAGGIDVNIRAGDGSSALHCAARAGHTILVGFLLQKGADTDAINLKKRSPLHEALLSQNLETVEILLHGGACLYPSIVTENSLAWSGHADILKTCLDHLSKESQRHVMYNTLIAASRDGQDNTVKALLPLFERPFTGSGGIERPFTFTAWEKYRYLRTFDPTQSRPLSELTRFTPLHVAAAKGHWQIVQMLVDYGANINQSLKGITALHLASARGHAETVRYMLSLPGIQVTGISHLNGSTPLHRAAMHGRADIVKLLLQDQRTIAKCKDHNGHTPLQYAACSGCPETLHALLNHESIEAAPEQAQMVQQGPVNPLEVLKRLLAHQDFQDVNLIVRSSFFRWTTLLKAMIHNGRDDCVQLLLKHPDINVNHKEWFRDETPLIIVSELGNMEMVKLLLQRKDIASISKVGGGRLRCRQPEGKVMPILSISFANTAP